MELAVNGVTTSTNADRSEIREALSGLSGSGDSFAILSAADQRYVQAMACGPHGFRVEYRDGSERSHFAAARSLSLEETTAVFESFLDGGTGYKHAHQWSSIGEAAPGRSLSLALIVGVIALLGGYLVFRQVTIAPRYMPLAGFGAILGGTLMWLILGYRRSSRQTTHAGMLVVLGFVIAAQLLLGDLAVKVLAVSVSVTVLTVVVARAIWTALRPTERGSCRPD